MEQYYEQSVAADFNPRRRAIYILCWMLIVIFVILALFFAAGALNESGAGLKISWANMIAAVVFLLAAGFVFVRKDYLRMEYDYAYQNGTIEVCGIMNQRRRKKLLSLDIGRISYAGCIPPGAYERRDLKIHKWSAGGESLCLCYTEGNTRHMALLDLDDEFSRILRRQLPAGVWHDGEGKK